MSIIVRPMNATLIRDTDFFTKMVTFRLLRIPTVKSTSEDSVSSLTYAIMAAKAQLGTLL